ncbi:S1C family serine protease [Fischerella sp. PCC 9605]|uniref:S1C family serine protease n=1 Tax=Fischerella sp. PCC 9605 TaxID=1173024 RepID=UPI0004B1445E|nr:trypsin-like peptidase domain-containing protein [Fischerella sp. PCC 9605]
MPKEAREKRRKMNGKLLRIWTSVILTSVLFNGEISSTFAKIVEKVDQTQPPAQTLVQSSEEQTRIEVYETASPAVVTIRHGDVVGSGFIVTPNGLVLTNAHVVENAPSSVTVILADGKELQADVIGFQGQGLDLAAIKIRNQRRLPTLRLAAPGTVKVGQSVYAIGSPFGLEHTFTNGIVSRLDPRRGFIQHNAVINPGNSGGPLLNSKAEVIGVNTLLVNPNGNSNAGIGIAIATDRVKPFLVALQQGNSSSVARRQQPHNSTPVQLLPLDGQTVTAKLHSGDGILANGSYYQAYVFKGRAGEKITIEMNSKQIDPALFLLLPAQKKLVEQNDDISSKDFNARLVVTLPEGGTYVVLANAFERGESGEYSLRAFVNK